MATKISSQKYTPNGKTVSPLRAIAIILAHGALRLQKRQKQLDNSTEQSVHNNVMVTNGETL